MKKRAKRYPGAVHYYSPNSGTMQGHGHRQITLHDPGARSSASGVVSWIRQKNIEYHLVIDDHNKKVYQLFDFDRGARSMGNHGINGGWGNNKTGECNIQICLVTKGFTRFGSENAAMHLSDWAMGVIVEIAEAWDVPLKVRTRRFSEKKFIKWSGITMHRNGPKETHNDTGWTAKNHFKNWKKKQEKQKVKKKKEYRVVAINSKGNAKLVRKAGPKFNMSAGTSKFTKKQAIKAKKWAKNKKGIVAVYRNKKDYPFLVLDSDTKMVRPALAKKLNELGKKRKKIIFINEGWRTHARQWELWRAYKNGTGNLAAYPGTSNHEGGNAADCSIFVRGRSGTRINVGADSQCRSIMRSLNLCLPVGGENWHVEHGNTWRA